MLMTIQQLVCLYMGLLLVVLGIYDVENHDSDSYLTL